MREKLLNSRSKPARTAPCDDGVRTIQKIYRQFEKVSGGADGGVAGFNGSIRPKCLAQVLRALGVKDNELVDFGAGSGRVLISAVAEGASRSYGYELPENKGMKYVFDSMASAVKDRVKWIGKDILDLEELNGSPHCVFSFWVGFPLPVQERILQLCTQTATVKTIAVFKDSKWRHADQGMVFPRLFLASMIFFPCHLQSYLLWIGQSNHARVHSGLFQSRSSLACTVPDSAM